MLVFLVYAAHTQSRNSYDLIAEHQIGYSHPLGSVVDILFGGGRCNFFPESDERGCRSDDTDLISFAEEAGFTVAFNRSAFDDLDKGLGDARLPFLGLFNDGRQAS